MNKGILIAVGTVGALAFVFRKKAHAETMSSAEVDRANHDKASPNSFVTPASADLVTATAFALYLRSVPRYREDRKRVAAFQTREGLEPDGLYGIKTATLLADKYNIPPPRPIYYPKKDAKAAKEAYVRHILERAALDPQKARLWREAARIYQ